MKKWDFFALFTKDLFISTCVADLGYIQSTLIHIYDYQNDKLYISNKDIFFDKI